jgi:hypothetical protein
MGNRRGLAAGAAIFAGFCLALTPAVGRVDSVLGNRPGPVSLEALGSIGSFTPVTNDKRLARAYAQALSSARTQGFRFTPTAGSLSGRRSITIVVRAPDIGTISDLRGASPSSSSIGIGPVAYNLGAARGLGRFAAEVSSSREAEPLVSASALTPPRNFELDKSRRLTASLAFESQGVTGATPASPATLAGERSNAVDVASSYRLTHNLDVTAGVRYKDRQNRLSALTDDARDSQAVYLGTNFKF